MPFQPIRGRAGSEPFPMDLEDSSRDPATRKSLDAQNGSQRGERVISKQAQLLGVANPDVLDISWKEVEGPQPTQENRRQSKIAINFGLPGTKSLRTRSRSSVSYGSSGFGKDRERERGLLSFLPWRLGNKYMSKDTSPLPKFTSNLTEIPKRARQKSNPMPPKSSSFDISPEITLDTDITKMDGIVDLRALSTLMSPQTLLFAQDETTNVFDSENGMSNVDPIHITGATGVDGPDGLSNPVFDASNNGTHLVGSAETQKTYMNGVSHFKLNGTGNTSAFLNEPPWIGLTINTEDMPASRRYSLRASSGFTAYSPSKGGWTAPDSWAVKNDSDASEDDDHDEIEAGDDFGATSESEIGSPELGFSGMNFEETENTNKRFSRITIKSHLPEMRIQKSHVLRVFRANQTFITISVGLTATVSDVINELVRRLSSSNQNIDCVLYFSEKGIERSMAKNEKPVMIQKRRLEQVGYTDLDKFEDLGREDNSYLFRFLYKPSDICKNYQEPPEEGSESSMQTVSLRNVEVIPIRIYKQAHQIKSLNLTGNRGFSLPTDFVQLCLSLRELVLSNMGLKRIPPSLKECVTLVKLDVSSNNIQDFEQAPLNGLSELASLECHNNRLFSLPDYFDSFKKLNLLNLSNNRFEAIPPVLAKIISLIDLDLSFNTITSIPEDIGKLENLERLVLLANFLTVLPQAIGHLEKLMHFDCRRNSIEDLSPLSGAVKLETLQVEHNAIFVFQADWPNMRTLCASNNSITRFAMDATGRTLTTLNVSHAKLASLAHNMFDNLVMLERLTLDSNQIRVIPDGLGSLSNLKHFSMRNNLLDALPSTIGQLQQLTSLLVSGNNISSIPEEIWNCSKLETLNASSNLLKVFPNPPSLDGRKLSNASKSANSPNHSLANSLQNLYLADNKLGDGIIVLVSLLSNLRVLNLSMNDIYDISSQPGYSATALEELYLSGNKISILSFEFLKRHVNLRLLYLNGNKLLTLPADLSIVKDLVALDVGNNVLKYNIANCRFEWNWNFNPKLKYLNFSGNKGLKIPAAFTVDMGALVDENRLSQPMDPALLPTFMAFDNLCSLGLMDVTLLTSQSLYPDETEHLRVRTTVSEGIGYGISDTLGSQQEGLSSFDVVIPNFRFKSDEAVFGLFDAVFKTPIQGSAKYIRGLQDGFGPTFTLELSRLKSGEVTSDALRRTFLGMNRDYGNQLLASVLNPECKDLAGDSPKLRCCAASRIGACGIVVYIHKRIMYVANTGDALAVMSSRDGKARLVSKKHDPFERDEISKIRASEGWISNCGAVNDLVELSRTFGFYNLVPTINALPHIEEVELTDSDEFVIIANSGLWDYVSYQNAVDIARSLHSNPMGAAEKLRDTAIAYGSPNNVMVMFVAISDLFKPKIPYRSQTKMSDDEYFEQRIHAALRRTHVAGDRTLQGLPGEVEPPKGQVALVFTDIKNSTALWETNGGMPTAIRLHNDLLRRRLRVHRGYEVKTEGDAFMVSFNSVSSALLWCLSVQLDLLRVDWPQEILNSEDGKPIHDSKGFLIYRGLRVRMGIHWGSPMCENDPVTKRMDYFGSVVNRSARISSVADGGQIAVSQDVINFIENWVLQEQGCKDDESAFTSSNQLKEEDKGGWLDPMEQQDIAAICKLKLRTTTLGLRKLKGLETLEVLSLVWPLDLLGRLDYESKTLEQPPVQKEIKHTDIQKVVYTLSKVESVLERLAHSERISPLLAEELNLQQTSTLASGFISYSNIAALTQEELNEKQNQLISSLEDWLLIWSRPESIERPLEANSVLSGDESELTNVLTTSPKDIGSWSDSDEDVFVDFGSTN